MKISTGRGLVEPRADRADPQVDLILIGQFGHQGWCRSGKSQSG
jgi:hypothetical protein